MIWIKKTLMHISLIFYYSMVVLHLYLCSIQETIIFPRYFRLYVIVLRSYLRSIVRSIFARSVVVPAVRVLVVTPVLVSVPLPFDWLVTCLSPSFNSLPVDKKLCINIFLYRYTKYQNIISVYHLLVFVISCIHSCALIMRVQNIKIS